jgi:ribosomal protein S18 acetylase RimI-like enzyme
MNDYHIKDSNRDCWFVTVKDNAKEAISILERHGLICQSNVGENAWEKIVYFKELNAKNEIGEKQYNIRSLSINHEVEMYVDLHQKVFGTKNMNSIWRNRTVNGTRYNNKYDLVCVDDDGELIGFCVGWGNLGKKIGQIEPMGVLKKYEGKGIGSSLIQELEKRMLEDGIRKLIVETDLSRESALGIYKKNGFTEESKVLVYKKDIS